MHTDIEPAKDPAATFANVSKAYGGFYALRGLDVGFEPGMIHALVGQNGAGKSTCLGLLSGRIAPTEGIVTVLGEDHPRGLDARAATAAGIATVYQELSLFPEMSAIENVFIGQLGSSVRFVDWRRLRPRFAELSHRLGVTVDPAAKVGTLSLANQQMLEIMRGLALDSRILLLDEPTAVLAPDERTALFRVMRDLRDAGVTIIFVSHYLDEVLSISDTITVFRNGQLIEKAPGQRWSHTSLVEAMLGEEAAQLRQAERDRSAPAPTDHPEPLLTVEGLAVGKLSGIDLTVNRGEIVGIGGLVGSGRSTLLRALAGAQPARDGTMLWRGRLMPPPRTPRRAWQLGIGYIPEERKSEGLALERSSADNIIVGDIRRVSRFGWISPTAVRRRVGDLAERFGLSSRQLGLPVGQLSGGNQQKVLFARWGLRSPELLLADEATRGVDIGAKGQIIHMLREMADAGMGVVFVSSDLEEVASVSDRVYVFSHGRLAGHIGADDHPTQNGILKLAFGIGHES